MTEIEKLLARSDIAIASFDLNIRRYETFKRRIKTLKWYQIFARDKMDRIMKRSWLKAKKSLAENKRILVTICMVPLFKYPTFKERAENK